MACLRKVTNKKGTVYHVDFTFGGKRFIRSTGTSDQIQAKRILHDIQGRIANGKFDLKDYNKKEIAVEAFFEEYFDTVKRDKKPATIVNERNYAKKFLAFTGDINLRVIDARLLDKWKAHVLSNVSETTFNIERRFLHAAFNKAVRWEYLGANPVSTLHKAKVAERRLHLTHAEQLKLFESIDHGISSATSGRGKQSLERFRMFVEFLLHTGLRRGEAILLRPKDIDLEKGACGVVQIEQTKSKRTRIVPLTRRASEILFDLGDKLFTRVNKNQASRRFALFASAAGLEGFKLHSLRHTFASNLVSRGVDIYPVSMLLGHADIRTSMIYAKLNTDALEEAILKLEQSTGECKETVMKYSVGKIAA